MKKTNIFIFLFAISSVISQESGSIFDTLDSAQIMDLDPSEEEEEFVDSSNSAGQPLTNDAQVVTTGVDEETDTPVKDQDAENESIPVGDYDPVKETSTETTEQEDTQNNEIEEDPAAELQEENDELAQQNKDLEQELVDTLSLINQYRISESEKLKDYAEEMTLLSKYNDYITYLIDAPLPVSESLTTTTSSEIIVNDESDDEDLEISLATIAVIALGFLFLFLHSFRDFWISFAGDELAQGCYTILVDTTILVIL